MVHVDENLAATPGKDDLDFKELFEQAISAGAGLPLAMPNAVKSGWTPSLLAEAMLAADPHGNGVDIRTVQNWFQDNDKGISSQNIVCLARVFGMGDPDAIAAWRTELRAANRRLAQKRIASRRSQSADPQRSLDTNASSTNQKLDQFHEPQRSLALLSERIFTNTNGLSIAMLVWAGYFFLCLSAFVTGNHALSYRLGPDTEKQIGFFWSLSWPVECLILYPIFFLLVAHTVSYWKSERWMFSHIEDPQDGWFNRINGLRLPFWVAMVVAFGFIFALQWGGVYVLGLTQIDDPALIDWVLIARIRPDVVSIWEALIVSFFAFLYSGMIYWLYFVGLLLLVSVSEDYYSLAKSHSSDQDLHRIRQVGRLLQSSVFRCTIIGIFVATVIQLNAIYLKSDGASSLDWLVNDIGFAFWFDRKPWAFVDQSAVSSLTSSVLLLLHLGIFCVCTIKLRQAGGALDKDDLNSKHMAEEPETVRWMAVHGSLAWQIGVLFLLSLNFVLLGDFVGFTFVLLLSLIVGVLGIFWPDKGPPPHHLKKRLMNTRLKP